MAHNLFSDFPMNVHSSVRLVTNGVSHDVRRDLQVAERRSPTAQLDLPALEAVAAGFQCKPAAILDFGR